LTGWIVEQAHSWVSALVAHNWAELFGNWLTIIGISLALTIWALIAGWRLHRGIARLRGEIASAAATVAATPPEALRFATQYEATDATLRQQNLLGPAWRDWTATLITPAEPHRPVRATVRPGEYLSLDPLWECGISPRLHAAMPNLLVGVGLILTFFGLSLALAAAGGIVGADKAMREAGLRDLLGTASAKFVFSLVGLACSILYASYRNWLLGDTERRLGGLLAALEKRIPLATPATLQTEANTQLANLADGMSTFTNQLAVAIGEQMNAAFDQRLGEHIGPLREAIDKLSGSIGTRNEDAIREMLEQFTAGLRGGSDEAMRKVTDSLADLARSMQDVRSGMAEAARQMASAAEQITERMATGADAAMTRISHQMEGLVTELRNLAQQTRDSGEEAVRRAAEQIAAAASAFAASSDKVGGALSGGASDAATRMTEAMETMKAQLGQLTGELATNLRSVGAGVADSGRSGAEALTAAAAASAATLREGGEAAARQLTEAAQALAETARHNAERIITLQREAAALAATLAEMRTALTDAAAPLRGATSDLAQAAASTERTSAALAETSRQITPAGEAIAAAATRLAEAEQRAGELARGLTGAVERFSGMDAELARVVQRLSSALTEFTTATTRFAKDTNEDMAKAATALHAGTENLTEALETLGAEVGRWQRR
jgi:ABC-type transporter Mla subunit MlaD